MARTATEGSRRTKGTGSVYQLPNGKYIGQCRVQGQRRSTAVCATRREAEKALRELLSNGDKGIVLSAEKLTLSKWLERWLEDIVKPNLRPATYDLYCRLVRLHIGPVLGHVKLIELQRAHLRTFHSALGVKGLSASTIHSAHNVISRSLQDALDYRHIAVNVARGMRLPSGSSKDMSVLDVSQAKTLLATASGTPLEPLWIFLLYSGCRIGEALALEWSSVDFECGTVRICQNLTRSKAFGPTKTDRGNRTITVPEPCLAALKSHRARQNEHRLAAGPLWQDSGLVFCTSRAGYSPRGATMPGSPLTVRRVQESFTALLAKAGLPHMGIHGLRHAAATMMLESGVPLKVASARLGHASSAVTADIYQHVTSALDRDASDRVSALLA